MSEVSRRLFLGAAATAAATTLATDAAAQTPDVDAGAPGSSGRTGPG